MRSYKPEYYAKQYDRVEQYCKMIMDQDNQNNKILSDRKYQTHIFSNLFFMDDEFTEEFTK